MNAGTFDTSLFVSGLQLAIHLSIPILLAILGGAIIAGIFRVATQIDDQLIGLLGRLSGLAVFLYLSAPSIFNQLTQFASRVWGGSDFYH